MKHRIIFLDLDGTFYQTKENIIAAADLAAIKALKAQGFLIAAATGRSLVHLQLILQHLTFDYYILANGSYALDRNYHPVASFPLEKSALEDIIAFALANNYPLLFHCQEGSAIYKGTAAMLAFADHFHIRQSIINDRHYYRNHTVYAAVIAADNDNNLQAFLKTHSQLRYDQSITPLEANYYDIFNKTNDKALAAEYILRKAQLTWQDAIAIGDSTNDLALLKKADLGIAMGNAAKAIKEAADLVTADVKHCGVSKAIATLSEQNLL